VATWAALWSGLAEERKGGWEEEELPRAQDIGPVAPARMARQASLVAPMHVARQGRPRQRPRGPGSGPSASVAALSRQPKWRDRGHLSHQCGWRGQTGCTAKIKSIPS